MHIDLLARFIVTTILFPPHISPKIQNIINKQYIRTYQIIQFIKLIIILCSGVYLLVIKSRAFYLSVIRVQAKIHKVDQKPWSDKHIMDMSCSSVHKSFLSRVLLWASIVLKCSCVSTLLISGLLVILVWENKNETDA